MPALANAAAIESAATGYRALFERGREQVSTFYTDYSQEVPSTGHAENYSMAPLGVSIREWTGDRRIKSVKLYDYTLVNADYEGTFSVPRNAFEDDRLGHFNAQAQMLGVEAARHPDELLSTLLSNGFSSTNTIYGVAFFSNSQPTADGANNRDNLVTGALSAAKFEECYQLLEGMKAFNGKPIHPIGLGAGVDLIVPPALRSTAELILEAQQTNDGTASISNTNRGKARVVVNPWLSTATEYYLAVRGAPMAPFIFQNRRAHRLVVINQPTSEDLFYRKQIVFGTDGRYTLGYGHPELIIGSQGT